ncbi:unnamed protein product [Adineta steineri]|uniref:Uncharacterized protein n=1 Tax=Adineta steineri TaxID=433720 RepID=A0A814DKI8_9BILA|nr:unnamed protein product [Adineta steineri]CAF0960724.1 unnamed protein product [Adineta steineri]
MAEYNLSSTLLNEIQNHDDLEVVWLYSGDYISNKVENFGEYFKTFKSAEECENYIEKIESERKILLVLIDSSIYVSYFNDFPQIQSIYVLERNMKYEKEDFSKVIDIFPDEHILIKQIRQDILLTFRNNFPNSISCVKDMTVEQSFTNLYVTELNFLWNFTLINYLINYPQADMDRLKTDMINQCQLEYENSSIQISHINDFAKNCTDKNVLNWYTKNVFAYRVVNRAFRSRNIDLIYKYQYFIILLYKKLKELSLEQQQRNYKKVYRGQLIMENELNIIKSNVGHFISINTIMSTTRNEQVARQFILDAKLGVIIEIDITNASNDTLYPFADISKHSSMEDEEETLFFSGAIFHIDSVKQENDSVWIIKLTLKNGESIDIEKFLVLYILIGNNYYHLFNYDKALDYYNTVIELLNDSNKLIGSNRLIEQANEFDQGFPQLSHLYNERFVNYARNRADIHLNLSPPQQADRLYSIGVYLIKTNDYNQALEKLLQAKELFEKHLSLNDFPEKFGKLYKKNCFSLFTIKELFSSIGYVEESY